MLEDTGCSVLGTDCAGCDTGGECVRSPPGLPEPEDTDCAVLDTDCSGFHTGDHGVHFPLETSPATPSLTGDGSMRPGQA